MPLKLFLQVCDTDNAFNGIMWVCSSCFENNDNDDKSCGHCSQTRAIPTKQKPVEGNAIADGKKSIADLSTPLLRPRKRLQPRVKSQTAIFDDLEKNKRDGVDKQEQRLVLLGKTGAGKSSTANSILGAQILTAKTSAKSTTEKCKSECRERFGKKLLLVDTPGFLDTHTPREVTETEVKKCIGISAPGPHAFLLVMSFTNRFTEEEKDVFKEVNDMFGERMINYLIVVFTGRDQFDKSSSIEHHIEEYIQGYPEDFRNLVQKAGGGYVTFNNRGKESEKEDDVQNLLIRIDEMVKRNGGGHFTSEMFEVAEDIIQQRIANELAVEKEEIRKEVEDEIRKELEEEMKGKHDAELSRLKELREEDLLQYEILKRELDKEQRKNNKNIEPVRHLKGALRPLMIGEMKINAVKNLIQQFEKCKGPERPEVHCQLTSAGQEIQKLLQTRRKMADSEAEFEENQESVINELQENADRATEKSLVELRDKERENIENEKEVLQKMKEKM